MIIQPFYNFLNSTLINNTTLANNAHLSDYYRLMTLIKFGGIYLDDDMILLQDNYVPFMKSKLPVMGEETQASIANGFMISPPGATIFLRWLLEYEQGYVQSPFGVSSVMKIWALWQKYPDEINVQRGTMVRPSFKELRYLFKEYLNWKPSYNIHLNGRYMAEELKKVGKALEKLSDIDCIENTFGEITRQVLYGNRNLC